MQVAWSIRSAASTVSSGSGGATAVVTGAWHDSAVAGTAAAIVGIPLRTPKRGPEAEFGRDKGANFDRSRANLSSAECGRFRGEICPIPARNWWIPGRLCRFRANVGRFRSIPNVRQTGRASTRNDTPLPKKQKQTTKARKRKRTHGHIRRQSEDKTRRLPMGRGWGAMSARRSARLNFSVFATAFREQQFASGRGGPKFGRFCA